MITKSLHLKKKWRKYCKYHNKWNHCTNSCVHFRDLIQGAIKEGRLKFKEKPNAMKVDTDPFVNSANMVEPIFLGMMDAATLDLVALEEAMMDITDLDAIMADIETPHSVTANNETCRFDILEKIFSISCFERRRAMAMQYYPQDTGSSLTSLRPNRLRVLISKSIIRRLCANSSGVKMQP